MKRLLIILLSIIAIVSCELAEQPLIEEIEENAPAWDSGMSGTGSEKNPYVIASEEEFLLFKENIENGTLETEGKVFSLESDLDFSDMESWDPVGNAERASEEAVGTVFKGMFDGNGHTITLPDMTDYAPTDTADSAFGLFSAVVGEGSGVRNLTVSGKLVTNSENAGMIAGLATNGAVIENCTTAVGSSITGAQAGGLVGRMMGSGKIIGSTNNASVTGTSGKAGGVAHTVYYPVDEPMDPAPFVLQGITNNGEITGTSYVGGIAGILTEVDVDDARNTGTVSAGKVVGGIVGRFDPPSSMRNTSNSGTIKALASSTDTFGGIVGAIGGDEANLEETSTFDNVTNEGEFDFTAQPVIDSVGGIYGVNEYKNVIVIKNSSNNASIDSQGVKIGGLVGTSQASSLTITDSHNHGEELKGPGYIGGLVGISTDNNVEVIGSSNKASLSGTKWIGGLIGQPQVSLLILPPIQGQSQQQKMIMQIRWMPILVVSSDWLLMPTL